jgi:TatD DNase family protein
LKIVLDLGFYVGFDGNITYNGIAPGEDTSLKDLAKYTPIDRIVVETDSPFLTPEPKRGGRNMPEYVIITARFIAELKGVSFENFEAKTTENTLKIFSL